MERLLRDYEKLLKVLIEHDGQVAFLRKRAEELSADQIRSEYFILYDLDRLDYISLVKDEEGAIVGTRVSVRSPDPSLADAGGAIPENELSITYPTGHFLRARGRAYFPEIRRELIRWVASVVFVSVVGGAFAGLISKLLG